MTFQHWQVLMDKLSLSCNKSTYDALIKAYSQPHRHYHNMTHIEYSIEHLNNCVDLADCPQELELALWFHDAVYKPFSSTNELDSANWAVSFLKENNASQKRINRVSNLILATLHNGDPQTQDEKLLVDIDLAILGCSKETFLEFEKRIRAEYRWVPWFLYRKKRRDVLKTFIERDAIYSTKLFFEQFEQNARNNIFAALVALG